MSKPMGRIPNKRERSMHRGNTNCRAEVMMIAMTLLAAAGALVLAIMAVRWVNSADLGGDEGTGSARAVSPEPSETES